MRGTLLVYQWCVHPRARLTDMPGPRLVRRQLPVIARAIALALVCASAHAEAPQTGFFRGINLNGPPLVIDGHQWEGNDSPHLDTRDQAFENEQVPLIPPTDPERTR